MKIEKGKARWTGAGIIFSILCGSPVWADDTELLLVVPNKIDQQFNANILLMIDSSGSMNTLERTAAPYDSSVTYAGICDPTKLYWTELGFPPGCGAENNKYIDSSVLSCFPAKRLLDGIGTYTDVLAQYRDGSATAVTYEETSPTIWQTLQPGNATDPVSCAREGSASGIAWGSYPTSVTYTLYSGNYLNWKQNPVLVDMSRIDIVKTSAKTALSSINSSNIAIMRFNEMSGGPVIMAMKDLDSNRASIDSVIDGIAAGGRTPLSETAYEAALYWLGAPAHYGELINEHPTDPDALRSTGPEVYLAPDSPACTKNYNVFLTDGEPVDDLDTPTLAPTLPGFQKKLGRTACTGTNEGDCLDDITEYLSIPDLDAAQQGDQFVTTHTIGFTIDLPILKSAADVSGGEYYLADDVENLTRALLQIFETANEQSLSFTSPSVAVSAFNRTQNLNDLYMTVFRAKNKVHWPGNLKKYRVVDRVITDANGLAAVDPATGFFNDSATSFWTTGGPDGKEVELGGAANMLPDPAVRNLYTNNGSDANLTGVSNALTPANATAFSLSDFGLTGSSGEPTIEQLIRWARGEDLLDEDSNTSTLVRNVMGDPLHSQPTAVVYGGSSGNEDVVVFAATNDGYLHAIDGKTGSELWSFIPKELLSNLPKLMFDPDSSFKNYGIDGDLVAVVSDADQNGVIDGSDFVYLIFGMRRGGNSYYALDVTDKNAPKLMWNVTYPGFGQSWARPSVVRVDIANAAQNAEKATVVIGGGYDSAHDTATYPSTPDVAGANIYMLDLVSGAELWRAGRDSNADLQLASMTRAFPTQIKVADLNGDRLADRMYATDVGGQIWRFDITNGQDPATLVAGGVIAQVGAEGLASPGTADTRRVYNSPDISIFTDNLHGRKYIAVSIGSGYRAHPLNTSATDRFYSVRDPDVFHRLSQAEYDSYPVATDADLIEVSGKTQVALSPTDRGWKFTLPSAQMVLADSVTFDNTVYFVGFAPALNAIDACETTVGRNFLYRMSIVNGDPVVNNLDTLDPAFSDNARMTQLQQGGIAPTPTILFPSPDDPNCTGADCAPPPIGCVGVECFDPGFANNPVRTLWTQDGIQ